MILSGTTTPGQSWRGSDGNEGVLRIPQTPIITETSPTDCFVIFRTLVTEGSNPANRNAVGIFNSHAE